VEAGGWVLFDVLATDQAGAAHVAMWLRELLPGATIMSAPDAAGSGDAEMPHRLRCRAAIPGSSLAQARAALEQALREVDEPKARVVFPDSA
jgi:hypothetical protein